MSCEASTTLEAPIVDKLKLENKQTCASQTCMMLLDQRRAAPLLLFVAMLLGSTSLNVSASCNCEDKAPSGDYTCQEQRDYGACGAEWMRAGKYCLKTCGYCKCVGDCACTDVPPSSDYTCQQQKEYGKCSEPFMKEGGYCMGTCGFCTCDSSNGSPSASKPPAKSPTPVKSPSKSPSPSSKAPARSPAPKKGAQAAAPTSNATRPTATNVSSISPEERYNDVVSCKSGGSLLAYLQEAGNFTELVNFIQSTPTVEKELQSDDLKITFFAPNDQAFASYYRQQGVTPNELITTYPANLQSLLLYHISPNVVAPTRFATLRVMPTVYNNFKVFPVGRNQLEAEKSKASILSVIKVCETVVYQVSDVLAPTSSVRDMPPYAPPKVEQPAVANCTDLSAYDAVQQTPDLETFFSVLQLTNQVNLLTDKKANLTVFAPNKMAFEKLAEDMKTTVQGLLVQNNIETLGAILRYHIVPRNIPGPDLGKRQLQTLNQTVPLFVNTVPGGIVLQSRGSDALILQEDIDKACNAAVHVIDTVLLPFRTNATAKRTIDPTTLASRRPTTRPAAPAAKAVPGVAPGANATRTAAGANATANATTVPSATVPSATAPADPVLGPAAEEVPEVPAEQTTVVPDSTAAAVAPAEETAATPAAVPAAAVPAAVPAGVPAAPPKTVAVQGRKMSRRRI